MAELDRLHHLVLGNLVPAALDHHQLGFAADIDQVQVAVQPLLVGRVDQQLAFDARYPHRADRPVPGNVRDRQGRRRAVDGENVGVVHPVGAEQDGDDLGIVVVAVREQRTDRAIGHARGEDLFLGRPAFALEITAREFAGRGGFLAVIDREREEIQVFSWLGAGGGGDQDHRVTVLDGDGAAGLLGQFAGFNTKGCIPNRGLDSLMHTNRSFPAAGERIGLME